MNCAHGASAARSFFKFLAFRIDALAAYGMRSPRGYSRHWQCAAIDGQPAALLHRTYALATLFESRFLPVA